ncbi:MAG TPA: hypothetical protein VFY36_05935, partial [Solirubrobacteraceae bacterium]|nr:hypothetical protein [Solirubrobacteraceae bacterium]
MRAIRYRAVLRGWAFHPNIPDDALAHVAPVKWDHIALTGDYLWSDIDKPRERFRPLRANRFNAKAFQTAWRTIL